MSCKQTKNIVEFWAEQILYREKKVTCRDNAKNFCLRIFYKYRILCLTNAQLRECYTILGTDYLSIPILHIQFNSLKVWRPSAICPHILFPLHSSVHTHTHIGTCACTRTHTHTHTHTASLAAHTEKWYLPFSQARTLYTVFIFEHTVGKGSTLVRSRCCGNKYLMLESNCLLWPWAP